MPCSLFAQEMKIKTGENPNKVELIASIEAGFLSVLSHKVQFSNNGDYFDYKSDGGQNVLFPVRRYSIQIRKGRNAVILLYQPLGLKTQVLLENDIDNDDLPKVQFKDCTN